MKNRLKEVIGANRPKVIVVIGLTREDVRAGLQHARTAHAPFPIWAWCADDSEFVEGCDRFFPNARASSVHEELRSGWPALILVAWTGERRARALKLIPFITPPFRFVVFNEARGFFTARPLSLAAHVGWRLRNAAYSGAERVVDWIKGAGNWLWNFMLACLGFLAKCTPWAAEFGIRRLRGGSAMEISVGPTQGSNWLELIIENRGWSRRKLANTILSTDADFIVFRRRGEQARPDSLIDLARQTNAFAVARQSAWTGWRRRVITKHPFRRLQAGEVTQVFAPSSTLTAVRRDVLLQFGIPGALTFGAALMILFWKAAAAGMVSLIAGHEGEITQEPAMELEDAEFVARLALSPKLRKMGPAHPHRSRGNVAWSSDERLGFRERPRVLIVSPYLPFPFSHGGAVRIYNLCRAMAGEIDFILACFREANDTVRYAELHEVFHEVYVVDADEKNTDLTVPAQVAEYRNTAMADLIRRLCVERSIDLVQLEYTQMAEYRDCAGVTPVILVEHDITFTLHRQLADSMPHDPGARNQYDLWLTFEREALQRSNKVWTMSERDREIAIDHGALRRNTAVIPNGVDLRRFQPVRRQTMGRAILFVGSFRHLPNLLAFEALRESVMPHIWRECADVKLHVIAGPHYERAVAVARRQKLLANDPRITIQGFVEDVRPAYRESDVVVIPLPISAGTNIKLMEAMACGRAIVSTPVGCQGLDLADGYDLLIRHLGLEFGAAVARLLQDDELRRSIALRARQTAEMRFGWDRIAREALDSCNALINLPISATL